MSDDTSAHDTMPDTKPGQLPHLDRRGHAHMVDISGKAVTVREASAHGFVRCSPAIVAALRDDTVPKGDALAVARLAGIAAVKRAPEILMLAHPIAIHHCRVELEVEDRGVRIRANVKTADRTGIEMEALTAVTVAALNVVDMVKGIDKDVSIECCEVTEKRGGRSGTWVRTPLAVGGGEYAEA